MRDTEQVLVQAQVCRTVYGLKVIVALATLVSGQIVAMSGRRIAERLWARGNADKIMSGFVGGIVNTALMAFVVVAALCQLGIQSARFIAINGAAGLATGRAPQGPLADFVAGLLLTTFRPFKVGEFDEACVGFAYPQRDGHLYETRPADIGRLYTATRGWRGAVKLNQSSA